MDDDAVAALPTKFKSILYLATVKLYWTVVVVVVPR